MERTEGSVFPLVGPAATRICPMTPITAKIRGFAPLAVEERAHRAEPSPEKFGLSLTARTFEHRALCVRFATNNGGMVENSAGYGYLVTVIQTACNKKGKDVARTRIFRAPMLAH